MRTLRLAVTVLAISCLARAQETRLERFAKLEWNWQPSILICLFLAVFLYLFGLWRVKRSVRPKLFGPLRIASFFGGIAILAAVLISPFDALDDELFCAHMAQHLVLMMVAPPLLIYGRAGAVSFWAFPLRVRRWLARFCTAAGLKNVWHLAMSPFSVWFLASTALWFWHIPGPYAAAVDSESIHAVEHMCFFVTSLMFWSLVIEPMGKRPMGYAPALLFVATFGLQNGLMGALLTFSGHAFYKAYLTTSILWGLTPLEDQQLGGLSMWIPASLIHLGTMAILFVAWMNDSERGKSGFVLSENRYPTSNPACDDGKFARR